MYGVDPPLTMKRVRSQNSQKNPRNKVVVRVPATSANMGPGFDALGLGLDIWNEISVERAAKFKITTEGEGAGAIPETVDDNGESNHMVIKALKRARSRRPAVLRRLHAIDATRVHQARSWVVYFSILRPFGPRRVTAMLHAGI